MQLKIPKLNSSYVPVHNVSYSKDSEYLNVHWWKKNSPFFYPYVLIGITSCDNKKMEEAKSNSENLFLLTDSGGFQVISDNCDLNWKTSLLKQIELGATKIFAFDKPPVKPLFKGSLNQFVYMNDTETKNIIKNNFEVALQQSQFLKENYPEEFKKFCYILHGKTKEHIEYNLYLFKEKFGGIENYLKYFPGGIVYASKSNDLILLTYFAIHAYENFISKGIYCHFLGAGSFNKMLILIRNKITTFDSSSMLQGARANEFVNPINITNSLTIITENFYNFFKKQFCICPFCNNIDYDNLIKKEIPIGRFFIGHNLWHTLKVNVFLDSLQKENYTKIVCENFKINDVVKKCLEFVDYYDKVGLEKSYEKYKIYLKYKKQIKESKKLFEF